MVCALRAGTRTVACDRKKILSSCALTALTPPAHDDTWSMKEVEPMKTMTLINSRSVRLRRSAVVSSAPSRLCASRDAARPNVAFGAEPRRVAGAVGQQPNEQLNVRTATTAVAIALNTTAHKPGPHAWSPPV